MGNSKLIGPFRQLLPLRNMPLKGSLKDEQLEIINEAGILTDKNFIQEIGNFNDLRNKFPKVETEILEGDFVGIPGMIDCHTHICFAGSRAKDFALRMNGKTYLDIQKSGGGIWSTVQATRLASQKQLEELTYQRLKTLSSNGITTVEIKSGYGLNVDEELKILRVIQTLKKENFIDIIPTCLAAHTLPKDTHKTKEEYLQMIINELIPIIQKENLTKRMDIFIEESAFDKVASTKFLKQLKQLDFEHTVHGDQFTVGGSEVAINTHALSVDHLEASGEKEINALSKSNVVAVVLPGASIGLGIPFAPARKILNQGCCLAIASDWNPGSAPSGDLLTQASILCSFEKLSLAEVFAGLTFRSASALGLKDRGSLDSNKQADFIAFPSSDYREIIYHQGTLKPLKIWKKAVLQS